MIRERTYTMQVGSYRKHAYNGCCLHLAIQGDAFEFTTKATPVAGLVRTERYALPKRSCLRLQSGDIYLFVRPTAFNVFRVGWNLDADELKDAVAGKISEISDRHHTFYNRDRYYRLIMPAGSVGNMAGYFGCHATSEGRGWQLGLLNLHIGGVDIQVFEEKYGDTYYFIVDCLEKTSLETFRKLYRTFFVAYAFLFGKYYGKQGAILSYADTLMNVPQSLLYFTYGQQFSSGFPIYSSNFYPYIKPKPVKDDKGHIVDYDYSAGEKLKLNWFQEADAGKLCRLIYDQPGIARALDLYITTFAAPLEIMVPTYFIIMEHVTFSLSGKSKETPMILNDPKAVTLLQSLQSDMKRKLEALGKELISERPDKKAEIGKAIERIRGAIGNINRGSNNQKITGLFAKYGYELSDEEKKLLLVERNKFLHGDEIIVRPEVDISVLFHYCMRLQKLMALLILKEIGYEGYILNNAKIYESLSHKKLQEKIFVKI